MTTLVIISPERGVAHGQRRTDRRGDPFLRKSRGLSQEVLSGLAGLDRTHYSKIERGLRSPSIDTLFKIARALDMRPSELVLAIERAEQEQGGTA